MWVPGATWGLFLPKPFDPGFFLLYNKYKCGRNKMAEQPLSKTELNHYTNLWCRQRGIHARDLESHPRADDVVLLLNFRQELWNDITYSNQRTWDAYWGWVYTQKKPLRDKHLTKLKHIAINGMNTRKFKQLKARELRQRIYQLRQHKNPTALGQNKISADDMTAKDAGSTQSVPWD